MNSTELPQKPLPSLSSVVEKIKQKTSILEIIGQDVLLRKVGKNYSGLCPFHSERTPSFTVNNEKGLYHCYGCKAGGDLISYVMETHGQSFSEAVEFLADRVGLHTEIQKSGLSNPVHTQLLQKQKTAYKLNRFVSFYYKEVLDRHPHVLDYLKKRGIDNDLIKNFYVGYSEEAWDHLGLYLSQKKAPIEVGFELGLFQKSKKTQSSNSFPYFDTFRNRVMFPILDTKGHVVGFGGRLLPSPNSSMGKGEDAANAASQPKYMNSPESFLFKKNQELFGIFQAKKHIREMNEAIIVEGFFDVIGMHAAGFPQTVATCGTALSLVHLKQVYRFCEKVIIFFDGDEAGQSALIKAMELGLQNNWMLYGAFLPEGQDPHDLSQTDSGKILLKKLIQEARPVLDALIEKELNNKQLTEEEKNLGLKKILSWLQHYSDPVGKELRVNRISELTGIHKNTFLKELKMSPIPTSPLIHQPFKRKPSPKSTVLMKKKYEPWECVLLQSQFHHKTLDLLWDEVQHFFPKEMTKIDIFVNSLPKKLTLAADSFNHEQSKKIFEMETWEAWVLHNLKEISVENQAQVLSIIRELLLTMGGVLSESQVRGSFQIGLMKLWARFSQTLKLALRESESQEDFTAQNQRMKEYLEFQRKMKEFLNLYVNDQGS